MNATRAFSVDSQKHAGGYTHSNLRYPIILTEPQGKLEKPQADDIKVAAFETTNQNG